MPSAVTTTPESVLPFPDCNVSVINVLPFKATSSLAYPMYEITIMACVLETDNLKLPSASVVTPDEAPFSETVAPAKGPFASDTFPLIATLCAKTVLREKTMKQKNNKGHFENGIDVNCLLILVVISS